MTYQTGAHLRVLNDARRTAGDPSLAYIQSAVEDVTRGFSEFRQRQDARIAELEGAQDELNRRIAAASAVGGGDHAPTLDRSGRVRFSADVAQDLIGLLHGQPTNAATIGSDPSGGFGVDRDVDREVLRVIRNSTAMRRLALNGNLSPGFGSWQKIVATRGNQSGWSDEQSERPQTETPIFGAVEVTVSEIFCNAEVSNMLLDDSAFDVEQFFQGDVIDEFAAAEGEAFIDGNGSNRPVGLFRSPTSADGDATRPFGTLQYLPTGIAGGFGDAASPASSPYDVLADLIATMKTGYLANATWLMSPTTAATLRKVKDQDGRFIWQDSLMADQPPMLMGYPVELDENVPAIATDSLSIAFGDFSRGYVIVDRPGMMLVRDPYTKKGFTRFYFTRRVGGAVLDSRAIKFIKFSAV